VKHPVKHRLILNFRYIFRNINEVIKLVGNLRRQECSISNRNKKAAPRLCWIICRERS